MKCVDFILLKNDAIDLFFFTWATDLQPPFYFEIKIFLIHLIEMIFFFLVKLSESLSTALLEVNFTF